MASPDIDRHRVVIVGGGFGALPAARWLARKPVDITVTDGRNHHLFQPLLYQVATGLIPPGEVSPTICHVPPTHKNIRVECAEVTRLDPDKSASFTPPC